MWKYIFTSSIADQLKRSVRVVTQTLTGEFLVTCMKRVSDKSIKRENIIFIPKLSHKFVFSPSKFLEVVFLP